MFPMKPCRICGKFPSQRHHKDGNTENNIKSNIDFLCPKHHVYADRLPTLRRIAFSGGKESVKYAIRDDKGHFVKRS